MPFTGHYSIQKHKFICTSLVFSPVSLHKHTLSSAWSEFFYDPVALFFPFLFSQQKFNPLNVFCHFTLPLFIHSLILFKVELSPICFRSIYVCLYLFYSLSVLHLWTFQGPGVLHTQFSIHTKLVAVHPCIFFFLKILNFELLVTKYELWLLYKARDYFGKMLMSWLSDRVWDFVTRWITNIKWK